MKKLEYSIDQKEYDVLILGTGMTEALFAASLAKIDRKKVKYHFIYLLLIPSCQPIDSLDDWYLCILISDFDFPFLQPS